MTRNRAIGFVIELRIEADTHEQAVAAFERAASSLKESGYKSGWGSGGGGGPSVSAWCHPPRPAPLSDAELEKLRSLLGGAL
jgi:hypothetical protein